MLQKNIIKKSMSYDFLQLMKQLNLRTYLNFHFQVGGQQSKNLQFVVADTVNNTMCAEKYKAIKGNDLITPTMICAGNWAEGGVGSCQGDSGGPLYYNGTVYGIISFGHSCAKPEYPGVSTNIATYAQWINETINENKVE